MSRVEFSVEGVRKAVVKAGTGKLRNRHCTIVEAPPVRGKNGQKLAPYRMMGCFKSKSEAIDRAKQAANTRGSLAGLGSRKRRR